MRIADMLSEIQQTVKGWGLECHISTSCTRSNESIRAKIYAANATHEFEEAECFHASESAEDLAIQRDSILKEIREGLIENG